MNIESLRAMLEQASLASLGIGFLLGFVFTFNPVALTSIPVSLAYVTKAREPKTAILYGGLFILGMVIVQTLLGLTAGLGGQWVTRLIDREWGLVLGPALILLGLMWPGWIRLPLPVIPIRAKRVGSGWGAAVLGASFAVAVCPFCTPALVVLLGIAAGIGSPLFGATLLFAFALGRAVPVLLGAAAVGWLESLSALQRYRKAFEIAGAVTLMLAGLYMLNAYFIVIPALAV
ncbi:sulfite exporter TauE/SafE family protein (plasmid) [Burkholderia thailandensis]|uniref:cytochrome c biogenesis CcdA family protein n=1 Tax=Burkholderia thailandensis TaxID=57975 RepID=UPI00192E1887|nr:cytochrome c biogenesis protein CcdA [Burkholderia thailandensis]MBS2132285.1 sulfite exporter TauE/SafE family protein [Burkholderia thailandensis]QRA15374.1 sulfite exporter TauE/SafE family protein [Burkholderia thailandensis]